MNIPKDKNSVLASAGVVNNTTTTIGLVLGDPSTGAAVVDDNTTGTNKASHQAVKDANSGAVLMITSYLDGVTLFPLSIDANGNLMIQST